MEVYKDRFFSALLGVMTFIVFEPFEFPDDWRRYPVIVAFMVVSVLCVLLSEFVVTKILRMPYDLSRGMKYISHRYRFFVPLNITLLTFSIATLFYLVNADPEVDYFGFDSLAYLVVCLICISIFQRLYWQNRYNAKILAQDLCEAQRINGILQERERQRHKETESADVKQVTLQEVKKEICITGTTKESVQLMSEDLLFVESNGNYITVHYIRDGNATKTDIRTSIKDVAELLLPYTSIMRCHRAFIVNLANVTSLERRSSGMELLLRSYDERIPVSKSYIQELKQRLQNPE